MRTSPSCRPTIPRGATSTINELTRREFAERGHRGHHASTTASTSTRRPGDRAATRRLLGVGRRRAAGRSIPCGPSRARTCPPRSALAEALGGDLLAARAGGGRLRTASSTACWPAPLPRDPPAPLPARARRRTPRADAVAFPSTWEGFGNPPIEAALHRRPVAVGPYPVGARAARRSASDGSTPTTPRRSRRVLARPDEQLLDHNGASPASTSRSSGWRRRSTAAR